MVLSLPPHDRPTPSSTQNTAIKYCASHYLIEAAVSLRWQSDQIKGNLTVADFSNFRRALNRISPFRFSTRLSPSPFVRRWSWLVISRRGLCHFSTDLTILIASTPKKPRIVFQVSLSPAVFKWPMKDVFLLCGSLFPSNNTV